SPAARRSAVSACSTLTISGNPVEQDLNTLATRVIGSGREASVLAYRGSNTLDSATGVQPESGEAGEHLLAVRGGGPVASWGWRSDDRIERPEYPCGAVAGPAFSPA